MLVVEYKFGNTIVRVHDDCYDAIIKRLEEIANRVEVEECLY